MEKSTATKRFLCIGLLVFIIFSVFAEDFLLVPHKPIVTVDEKITFSLLIPEYKAEQVNFTLSDLPDSVEFFSSQKKTVIHNGLNATLVELEFIFTRAGEYILPSVSFQLLRESFFVGFDKIMVFEKKENMIARGFWQLESNNLFSQEKIILSLNVHYLKKITSLKYDLPENSFFTLIDDLQTDFSNQETIYYQTMCVGKFEWTPLASQNYSIPSAKIHAVDVHNNSIEFIIPEKKIFIQESLTSDGFNEGDESRSKLFFENSFLPEENQAEQHRVSDEDILNNIQALRTLEREKLLFFVYQKQRHDYEQAHGITINRNEFPQFFLTVTLFFLALFFAGFIICLILKKNLIFVILLFCASAGLFAFEFFVLQKKHALIVEKNIYAIPSESARVIDQIQVGTCVQINKTIGQWVYVSFHENEKGWIKKDSLLFY
ncbi:MAG: SH3 domain-containing protein [Treponemataceae bacterium]